jgi:serine/threonine-protein kinase
LYALGVVLYWLLTDRMPHEAADVPELADAVVRRVPRAPRVLNPRVPEVLSALCLRMLDKRVERRVPDAASLCTELEALLVGADASWEVPLCDAYSASTATTEAAGPLSNADRIARWLKQDLVRPRRGPRAGAPEAAPPPTVEAQEPLPLPDDEQLAEPPTPSDTVRSRWRVVGLGLALLVGIAVVLGAMNGLAPGPAASPEGAGREVAPPERPPEAEKAAVPPEAAPTPAAVAPRATPSKEDTPVKTQKKAGAPAPRQGLGPLEKVAAVAATCTALACPSVPVRHEPPSEPCPPGAVETMKQLHILIGDKQPASFQFRFADAGPIAVREGSTLLWLIDDMGDIKSGATLSGHLIFGEKRVYGRLTETRRTPDGQRIPVCLEIWDGHGGRGVIRDDKDGDDIATVFSTVFVNPVREFE